MSAISDQPYNWYNLELNFRIYLSAVKKIRPVSVKNYLSDIRHFIGWTSSEAAHLESTQPEIIMIPDNLEKYRLYLISSNLPLKTVNRRLSTLRSFCEFLVSQNILQSNPSKLLRNQGGHIQAAPSAPIEGQYISSLEDLNLPKSELDVIAQDISEFIHLTQSQSL